MRIPGKLSIVVPDGYIAYTAEQTRRSFHPIVIVPQGTPIEKADKTPQRLEILTYFTKENAEKIEIIISMTISIGNKLVN